MSRYCGGTAPTGHGMFATCGEDFYGIVHQCPVCRCRDAIESANKNGASLKNPFPQAEPDGYAPRGRLKPRTYLPGDPRAEWLHGWWSGIGVGAVIGAALMCMVIWSR